MKRIRYMLNHSDTEDFVEKSLPYSEKNLEIALSEARGGAYSIEDDGLPEPDTATADEVLNALLGVSE